MDRIITAGPTTQSALTAAGGAVTFDPANTSPVVVRIASLAAFHVLVSRAGTAATVSNATLIPDGEANVRVNVGETVSVIIAAGETDGIVTFTTQLEDR